MKKRTRYLAAVMSIIVLILTVSGCGKDKNGAGKDDGGTTITMGRQILQNPNMPEGDTYEDNAYTRMVKEELGISIVDEFEANGEDYDRQVSLALSAGEIPDIMKVVTYDELKELYENDLLADLTDVYDEYASDYLKGIYDTYEGRALERVTFDDRIMALPGTNVDAGPSQVWIRSDWMKSLDLEIDADGDRIITIDELKMVASEFMDKNPAGAENVVGMSFAPWLTSGDSDGTFTMNAFAFALGATPKVWLEENGKVTYGSISDELKEAVQLIADWYEEGIVDPQLGTRTWDDISALLTNGQTGITFGTWHIPDWLLNNVKALDENAEFEAYALGDKSGKVNCTHGDATNGFIVVSKECANPEAAIKIVNLFYDDLVNSAELLEKYPEVDFYQREGVDGSARPFNIEIAAYTSLLDDFSDIAGGLSGELEMDQIKTAESKTLVEGIQKYLDDPDAAEVVDWAKYHSRMKGIQLIHTLTSEGKFNWITPVYPETTPTMETNKANLDKLEEETFIKMATGAVSVEEGFAEFVDEWHKQGGSKIIEEIEAYLK